MLPKRLTFAPYTTPTHPTQLVYRPAIYGLVEAFHANARALGKTDQLWSKHRLRSLENVMDRVDANRLKRSGGLSK